MRGRFTRQVLPWATRCAESPRRRCFSVAIPGSRVPWIAATIAAALRETGASVESAGVIPTPAVAFLARTHGFDAGVVISASHNPWRDNGIKLLERTDSSCRTLRNLRWRTRSFDTQRSPIFPIAMELPPLQDNSTLRADYVQFLTECVPELHLEGLRIVADCANGAAAAVAPELFARLRARIPMNLRY